MSSIYNHFLDVFVLKKKGDKPTWKQWVTKGSISQNHRLKLLPFIEGLLTTLLKIQQAFLKPILCQTLGLTGKKVPTIKIFLVFYNKRVMPFFVYWYRCTIHYGKRKPVLYMEHIDQLSPKLLRHFNPPRWWFSFRTEILEVIFRDLSSFWQDRYHKLY